MPPRISAPGIRSTPVDGRKLITTVGQASRSLLPGPFPNSLTTHPFANSLNQLLRQVTQGAFLMSGRGFRNRVPKCCWSMQSLRPSVLCSRVPEVRLARTGSYKGGISMTTHSGWKTGLVAATVGALAGLRFSCRPRPTRRPNCACTHSLAPATSSSARILEPWKAQVEEGERRRTDPLRSTRRCSWAAARA